MRGDPFNPPHPMKTSSSTVQFTGATAPACAVALFLILLTHAARGEITLPALLLEMTDRDAVASLPAPAYTLRQSSSHDPRKTDPANADGWHSNNDHDNAIRTEVNQGRNEWVIMEDMGPGAVVRYWTPLAEDRNNQIIRFYLDGSPTPAITAKLNDLFRGCGFVPPPFAFVYFDETDLRHQLEKPRTDAKGVGGDLYLPIPYAKGCKITLDSVPFYYVINFRSYEAGTAVKSFSMEDFEAAKPLLKTTGEKMLEDPAPAVALERRKSWILAAGEERGIDLPPGPAAVCELRVEIMPEEAPLALRFIQSTKVGDFIELAIPLADHKPHKLILHATRSYDYAILRFTVNGQAAAKDVDFFHPEPMLAEPVELGTFQAQDGKLLLRAEVIGANAASRGPRFYCGFDCVELR